MKTKINLLLAIVITTNLFSASCWNIKDDITNDFKELDSTMVFSFKDAVNCELISNVNVKFFGQSFTTDMNNN